METYSRSQIRERLLHSTAKKAPVFIAGAGCGKSAQQAERGGADLIGIYTTSYFRMEGIYGVPQIFPLLNNNEKVVELLKLIAPVVKETPIVAGIMSNDPICDFDLLFDQLKMLGSSCIMNFPTIGMHSGRFRQAIDEADLGLRREMEMLGLARTKDLFTIGYAFNIEDALYCASSGIDMLILHMGRTVGGDIDGVKQTAIPLASAVEQVCLMYEAIRRENDDVIVLAHGGAISTPDDAEYMFQHSDVSGFLGASSYERIPIEKCQKDHIRMLKQLHIQ